MARLTPRSKRDSETIHRKVPRNLAWWDRPQGDAHEAVAQSVRHLDETQPYRRESYLHYLRMYSNRLGLAAMTGTDFGAAQDQGEKIRMNAIKSAIDTAVAMIATNRPRALYSTVGGPYSSRQRAKGQTKFVDGVFNATKQYIQALDVFLSGAIDGTCATKVSQEGGVIRHDRVVADEIVIDDNEAKYGTISQLFQHKEVSASVAEAKYGVDADEAKLIRDDSLRMRGIEDACSLMEVWRPPMKAGGKGRHVICTTNETYLDEPWDRGIPMAFWRWNNAPVGFWGVGAVEEAQPIQIEINYIAQKIQRLMTLATSVAWVQKGSGTTKRFTNQDFSVREYSGRPPIFQTIAAVSAEFFAHLDRLYTRLFELMGISMMQATSQKPAGIEAAEALKTLNDIGSKRFLHTGQRWEQYHMDVAELDLEAAREAVQQGYKVVVNAPGQWGEEAEEIQFEDVALDKNRYTCRVYPTSIIPETPSGKIDLFVKLSQANPMIGMYQLAFMSGVPDLEALVSKVNAPFELPEKMVANILEKGVYTPPYPAMNLQAARDCGTKEWMRATIQGCPKERLAMLDRWNEKVDALIEKSMPSAGAPMASGPGAMLAGALQPGGMPGMPPGMSPEAGLNQIMNAGPTGGPV